MSMKIGLSLEERIRKSLNPLSENLKIDSFVEVMKKERERLATREMARDSGKFSAASAKQGAKPVPGKESTGKRAASLKSEVEEFMRRDQFEGADPDEVSEFMEMAGRGYDINEDESK